jgi:hypothetical protein
MTTADGAFFSKEWADRVREALDRGPDEALRSTKLPTYWNWIDAVRARYADSWAIGVTDMPGGPRYLRIDWAGGACTAADIIGPDDPLDASYVLSADLATWRELLDGADPGKIVMYRRMRLEDGDVLRFFRGIYFFVESLAAVCRVDVR